MGNLVSSLLALAFIVGVFVLMLGGKKGFGSYWRFVLKILLGLIALYIGVIFLSRATMWLYEKILPITLICAGLAVIILIYNHYRY